MGLNSLILLFFWLWYRLHFWKVTCQIVPGYVTKYPPSSTFRWSLVGSFVWRKRLATQKQSSKYRMMEFLNEWYIIAFFLQRNVNFKVYFQLFLQHNRKLSKTTKKHRKPSGIWFVTEKHQLRGSTRQKESWNIHFSCFLYYLSRGEGSARPLPE